MKFDTAADHKHVCGRYVQFDTAVDNKHVSALCMLLFVSLQLQTWRRCVFSRDFLSYSSLPVHNQYCQVFYKNEMKQQ